jgi:hypothetical protein
MGLTSSIPIFQLVKSGNIMKEAPEAIAFGTVDYTVGGFGGFNLAPSNFTATAVPIVSVYLKSPTVYSAGTAYYPVITSNTAAQIIVRVHKISGGTVTEAANNEVTLSCICTQTSTNNNP